jgi:hypothetical protein
MFRPVRATGKVALMFGAALLLASAAFAQFGGRGGGRFGFNAVNPLNRDSFDGAFNFCRIQYVGASNGDGGNWSVDWPRADRNLTTRLSELTKAPISLTPAREPNHLLLQLTDEELFKCPFIMMTEVGSIFLYPEEAEALKNYLLKGGFLWVDDFWGEWAWQVWDSQIRKVLPSGAYPTIDLPPDHPIFRTVFNVPKVPQIASIGHWRGSGGGTSERYAESATPHMRGILDEAGRIMVLITHNTDIGDSFEEEASDRNYFINFSVDGYRLGINILIYAMSH